MGKCYVCKQFMNNCLPKCDLNHREIPKFCISFQAIIPDQCSSSKTLKSVWCEGQCQYWRTKKELFCDVTKLQTSYNTPIFYWFLLPLFVAKYEFASYPWSRHKLCNNMMPLNVFFFFSFQYLEHSNWREELFVTRSLFLWFFSL